MSSEEPWLLLAFLFPSQFTDDTGVRKMSCMSNGLFSIHGIEKKNINILLKSMNLQIKGVVVAQKLSLLNFDFYSMIYEIKK